MKSWAAWVGILPRVSLLAVCIATVCTACGGTAKLEQDLSRMRRDLRASQQENARLRRELTETEQRLQVLSSSGQREVANATHTIKAQFHNAAQGSANISRESDLKSGSLPIIQLNNDTQVDNWVDPGATDDGGPPLELRLGATDDSDLPNVEPLPVNREILRRPDPVNRPVRGLASPDHPAKLSAVAAARDGVPQRNHDVAQTDAIKHAYEAALRKLRQEGRPKEALMSLEHFLRDHPVSKYAGNAAYWIAECHYLLGDYQEALAAYGRVLAQFPKSAKFPDARLGKAMTWMQLEDWPQARRLLQTIKREHAGTEAAKSAEAQLAALAMDKKE